MWPAGRQLGALVWKNWLVRCRHRVLCLAEFLWPCLLFTVLTALRFQEPPRQRDTCYLQPRDLPSRGVLPFVRGLLCNTGARCRNSSDPAPPEHRLRFRATAAHHKIHDLVFLQEMQDLADGVREVMDEAINLKQLWAEGATAPGSYGSSFLTVDLNKTEEVIAALEGLHRQPQVWDFLLLLPRLFTGHVPADGGPRGPARPLQAALNSFTSPEELDRLPLNPAPSRASRMALKAAISAPTFLQEHGAAAAGVESGRSPQEVGADLQSRFGFDDLRAEQILSYSAEQREVLHRWPAGGRLQQVLEEALRSPLRGEGALQEAAEALQPGPLLLAGSETTEGRGSHAPPEAILNSTKEHLMKEKKLDALEDEQLNFLLSFVEFLEKLLLPNPLDSSSGPTKTILNAGRSWINHLKNLGGEPFAIDIQKLLEFGKEVIEKVHTLEKTESSYVLRFMEAILSEINPKFLELWMYGISKGKRTKFKNLSTLSKFSVLGNESILTKSFNFSKLFRSDWPESPAVKMDFVHLSESIIHSLYELGFLRQEQVSEILGTVYAVRNASNLFSALSEPQKREVDRVLTHIYPNVFKDPDSDFLLQIYSSFYQYTDKLLGIQSRESLLSFLTQTPKHIFEIIKQFNFQTISKAFEFLYETTKLLGEISEVSYCQQLLSVFNLLELQAQSLMSAERPELEVIHATLTGLKQLLMGDEDFRISLFQYMNQLFNSSLGTLLGNECFALNNKITSISYSVDGRPPLTLLWTQIHSNLSADGSVFSERLAVHCSISWLQKWAEIWGSTAQILELDVNVFIPLHIGLTQLLGELESDVKISKSCQGIFPIHRPARLILNLLKNMTQGGGLHDPDDFRNLRELWGAVRDALVRVKLLHPEQVERFLSTLDTALSQLKAFPPSTRAGREFLYPVLHVLTRLSNTSDYRDRHTHLINHFLLNNFTDYEENFESIITDLRETILFLRNVSHDDALLSCADSFQNITEFILKDGLSHENTSQRVLHILAMLNSFFSSEDIMSILKGCVEWVDIFNHSHVAYNPSFPPDHLQGVLKHLSDMENKINSTLTLVTWLLNTVESDCSLNKSNISCMNIYLKNVTNFLNVILTAVFEKEKAPKFEILLTLLDNSTNQVSMLINNLTRDFEFASQSNWKHFTELILRPIEMSEEITGQFQNTWLHLVGLGKEIQELVNDIFPNILENNFSFKAEKFLHMFTTSPKEKDIHRLGNSFFHLACYLVFNLSDDLQNSPQIIAHETVKAVGLGIQLIRDVFSFLMPEVHHNIPEDPGNNKVLKKIAFFLLTLKKTDIDLLVDQLQQGGESLMDLVRNNSRLGTDSLRVKLLIGLMEKFVDGSRSWNVSHLLRLSHLFPREDVTAVVDLYSALPHAVRLLQRVVDKNITKALKDVYDFTVLQDIGISHVTKEDFMFVMKTLLDTIELVSDKPGVLAKVVTCLPVVWCQNHTLSGFQQNPELEACNDHFYRKVASILDHLHLSPAGEAPQCSNESSLMEITKKMVCIIHELVDWSSILLELSEVFHVKASLMKTVQEFRHKVFPFVLSGNQSKGSTSGLCPPGPMKQVALQIIEKFRNVSFAKASSDENILDKLSLLNRILNNEGAEASLGNLSLSLERMIKSLSGDESLENRTRSVVSLFMMFLDANLQGRHFEALSSFIKRSKTAYNFVDLWLESEQAMKDPNLNRRILFSKINEAIPMINSMALQKMTVQLVHILESLNSSLLQLSEMTRGFPSVTKNWLRKYASEEYSRIIQIFFFLMANENSTLIKDVDTFLDYLKNISRGGDSHVDLFAQLVNQEQSTNFSVVRLLLKSFLVNSINNLAAGSPQAAWNLSDTDLQVLNLINLTLNQTPLEKGERILLPPGGMVEFMGQLLKTFFTFAEKENSDNKTSLLPKDLHDMVAEMSVAGMCQDSQQPSEPPAAVETPQRARTLLLRALLTLTENPALASDALCAARSCEPGGVRWLLASALRGLPVLHNLYQALEEAWTAPGPLDCEGLRRNLSRGLGRFQSHLENAAAWGCACPPAGDWTPRRLHTLAQRLEKDLFPGNLMTSLSNFTATVYVKVKDLVRNITAFTEELRSACLSPETISSILEANISRSQVLPGALRLLLSGRCDREVLRLLLAFPGDRKAGLAAKELCGLPGASAFSLLVSLSRNLDLRSLIYKTLMPAEAQGVLGSLLGVVSRLSHLLPQAGHVLEQLPQFLHTPNASAWLDLAAARQAVVAMVCPEQESFLSSSHLSLNLPRVNELLESDKEKFNIPEGSTPFCLKLYQEILQSPNGALVWSFLQPVLHGKILYSPSTPEVDKVIRKANHTFMFVDKLRTLSETLLSVASSSQSGGHGRMLGQLQEVLRNKFIRNFVESQLHINVDKLTEKLQTYGAALGRLGAAELLSLGRTLANLSSCVLLDRFQGLPSAAALEAAARGLRRQNRLLASVLFHTAPGRPLPPRVAYTIRTSLLYSMRTDQAENPFWRFHPQSLPADAFKYNYVFAPLQDMLERALLRAQTGRAAVGPGAQAQPIPYPCHSSDLFLNHVSFFLPLIMVLTWVVSVASMVRRLVYEREIQMEEYLRMMGAPPACSLLAWLLENAAVMAAGSAALAVVLKASGIFAHSDAGIVFLFLLDFAVSTVTLSYLLSVCFRRAAPAALCGSLLYLAGFLPYIALLVLRGRLSAAAQLLLCLLSTTAFGQGVFFVTFLEGQEAGVQWGNLFQPSEQAGLALGWVCVMILVDAGLYFLCGWYLSNLVPGAAGVRKPWYFPFVASYWRGARGLATQKPCARGSGPSSPREDAGHTGSLPQHGDGEREGGPPGVTLVSVTKEYQPRRAAVRDLTLTFHRGQITALLGANGAGKTTVLSLVTGLHAPTSGSVLVDGRDVHTDWAAVRKELGVCPQRDVLWDRLTVLEHLRLFAAVREPQWSRAERWQQVDRALRDVGLTPHRHKQARALSGGLRRRLSIGAAFLGTSRTVVLDEPTSGVDPCSRRGIWDILLQYREGRTIILTTHHLDEAEALSDRVAVLQQGRLRCCGPPLGLTEAHGRGPRLTLTEQPSPPELAGSLPDAAPTTALIQTYVPQAFLSDRSGHTLSYALPRDADRTAFPGLLRALEQSRHRLRLAGCGVADSSLEEVFLTLLHDPSEQSDAAPGAGLEAQRPRPPGPTPSYHYGAPASTLTQVAALLTQRLCRTRRAWRAALCDLLLPVLFVALAMSLFLVRPLATGYPALQLTPGRFGQAETSFFSSDSDGEELARVLVRAFGDGERPCARLAPGRTNASCWRPEPSSLPGAPGACGCRPWQSCPNASARAPSLTDRRGRTLLNLSALRPEEYLLAPGGSPRLGGWSFGVRGPDPAQDANSRPSKPERLAKVWYSQKAFHALPAYLNHLSNLLLWRLLPPAEDWTQYGITLYSRPYGGALLDEDKILESIRQCGVALCIVLGVSVLAAAIGSSVVRDRVSGAKRLQHLSGLGYGAYWFSHFLYDMLFYAVSAGLCVAVVAAFGLPAFTFRENLAATVLLLLLFGYATLPGMYLTSRLFPSADGAFTAYLSLHFVLGLCTLLMTTMPRLLAVSTGAQNLQAIYEVLKWVFTLFPQFCLGQGLIELCYNQIRFDLARGLGVDTYASPFRMSFLGWVFVQLAAQGTALLLLRLLLHGDVVRRARRRSAVQGTVTACADADVAAEQVRVLTGRTGGDLLVLCNLSKSYGRGRPAVRDVTLGLRSGECFGLLGANGAGKSTTFRMLSGDEAPSTGHAVVRTPAGEDVPLFAAGAAGVRVGYCPQQDALDEPLTGWEHLRYYCRLRGVPGPRIPQVAGDLARRLHLEAHVDKPVAAYSGGTRRKLSVALALLGKPHLLLLDEPSSGMDPSSKRFLWNAITEEVREGCAVVLSSHSMEECEALCTRLAIMADGSFRCLGTPQHVKERFGAGCTVRVGLSAGGSQHELSHRLQLRFPGARLQGQRRDVLEYQVPAGWAGLADLLQELEDCKAAGSIRHYALAPATLEQVFVDLAAEQQPAPPAPPEPPAPGRQPPPLPV